MSGLLAVLRGGGHTRHRSKHKKLLDDEPSEPVVDGVTFYVKYLGSCLVGEATGEEVTRGAVRTITAMANKQLGKVERVALTICLRGIKMVQCNTSEIRLDVSIYRVSYCSTDTSHNSVFAFIATNRNDTMECHAFVCPHRKMVQAATLTIAQAFNLAFKSWQQEQEKGDKEADKFGLVCDGLEGMKGVTTHKEASEDEGKSLVVTYSKAGDTSSIRLEGQEKLEKVEKVEKDKVEKEKVEQNKGELSAGDSQPLVERRETEKALPLPSLLIDLISMEQRQEEEDMMMSFTQLAQRQSPPTILRHLPQDAASRGVAAFAGPERGAEAALWRLG